MCIRDRPKKSNYSMGDIREAKEQAPISKRDETIIYVVFVIVSLCSSAPRSAT